MSIDRLPIQSNVVIRACQLRLANAPATSSVQIACLSRLLVSFDPGCSQMVEVLEDLLVLPIVDDHDYLLEILSKVVSHPTVTNSVIIRSVILICRMRSSCDVYMSGHNFLASLKLCCGNNGQFLMDYLKFASQLQTDRLRHTGICYACLYGVVLDRSITSHRRHDFDFSRLSFAEASDLHQYAMQMMGQGASDISQLVIDLFIDLMPIFTSSVVVSDGFVANIVDGRSASEKIGCGQAVVQSATTFYDDFARMLTSHLGLSTFTLRVAAVDLKLVRTAMISTL
jgi:hypothetical protein